MSGAAGVPCAASKSVCTAPGWRASCVRESIPEGAYKGTELRELLRTGRLMHAIQGWHIESCKVCCDGAIGQQHELLDQHVGPGALSPQDSVDFALGVEHNISLGQIEVEAPSGKALLAQD